VTTLLRKEEIDLGGEKIVFEVFGTADGKDSKVMITLMGNGAAVGRANLGQVFRGITHARAERIVEALLDAVTSPEDAGKSVDGAVKERLSGKAPADGTPLLPRSPTVSIELDAFFRKDLATDLRLLANEIEMASTKIVLTKAEVELQRGGGKEITVSARRLP
jgi:hypothetical protein